MNNRYARNFISMAVIILGLLIFRSNHGFLYDLTAVWMIGLGLDARFVRAHWPLTLTWLDKHGETGIMKNNL